MKLKIPVDLVTINCNMVEEGVKALEYSTKYIEFNNVFLLSDQTISGNFDLISIKKIRDVEDYNNEILNLSKHIKSEYVLIIQHDGHVINHKKWDDLFLKFDYLTLLLLLIFDIHQPIGIMLSLKRQQQTLHRLLLIYFSYLNLPIIP